MTEDKPIGQTFTPLVPTPAPPRQAVEVTEPVATGEPEKAKTSLSKAETAKEEANRAVATTRTAEVTKTETAKEGTAKVKVAREQAAKPKVAKEETSKAGEAAKKTEMAKIETVKAGTLSSAMTKAQTTKSAEAAKVEPAKSIELPKIELISRPETPAVTPPQPPTKMARVESKAQTSVPTAMPPSTNKSTTGPHSGWMIQAGSFSVLENANLLRDKLRGQNFSAYVESTTVGGRTLYRVRVGPQASQVESKAIAARLRREAGINAQVIPQND
jgi:DedD protein